MKDHLITGVGNLVASAARMQPAAPPRTYLGVAYGMLPGVKALAVANPTAPLALCLVAAHALECTLKAYLSRDGNDDVVKRPDIRHNLVALWKLAHIQGLRIPADPPGWVEMLGHLHNSPYYLRYSTGVHGIQSPASEPMTTELGQLLNLVEQS